MRYEIKGDSLPVVLCYLENGEKMITMPISNVAATLRPYFPSSN